METQPLMDMEWAPTSRTSVSVGVTIVDDSSDDEDDAPPVAYLIIYNSDSQKMEMPLRLGDNFVGRKLNSDVVLDDSSVSDSHAVITMDKDEAMVKDLKSRYAKYFEDLVMLLFANISNFNVVMVHLLRVGLQGRITFRNLRKVSH